MKSIGILSAAIVFLYSIIPTAHAESVTINARSGKTTLVYRFALYDTETCWSGAAPKVKFRQPKHGKFTSKRSTQKISPGKSCAGKTIKGVSVYYTPNSGYRGKDKGRISFTFARYSDGDGYAHHGVNATLNVK